MKKKLTVAIVLILLLAVSLTMFVGCDEIIKRNEERDNTQVVASVDYNGMSANIYKYELISSYNSYSYIYESYYGMSKKETANYILRSLAQQKLLTLYAKAKVTTLKGLESIPADVTDLLTKSEINKAVEDTNESLLTQLKNRVEAAINEDNYNNEEANKPSDEEDDDKDVEITEAVTVRFNSNGGSDVERQRIQKDTKAKKPTDPTKDGYVFYGWYEDASCNDVDFVAGKFETNADGKTEYISGEFDFSIKIDENKTLYARWIETTEARTEMPKPAEEEYKDDDDYDPDDDSETTVIAPYFFTDEYKATIAEKFAEEDFVEKIDKNSNKTLDSYISDCIADLFKDYKSSLYKKTDEECYNYFLAQQYDSVLVEKMKRLINKDVKVTEDEIKKEFNAVVNKNKQSFTGSNGESAYESALTSTLNSTYYHPTLEGATGSYGFVINILLKLDDESLNKIIDMDKIDPGQDGGAKKARIVRNRLISEMQIKVSNPNYKSGEKVEDEDGKEIELRDPMTDPRNPYNAAGGKTKNTKFEAEDGNDYENLVKFVYNEDTEEFEITYGATEHAAMPYLEKKVYAFDKDGKVGIIHQIHKSLDDVKTYVEEGKLTKEQGVYWLREVATKWLYLVGDDSGAVTDSSNNGGLGYLVSPEGKDSNFLTDFTKYARALVAQGTGAYSVPGDSDADLFVGTTTPDGTLNGNGLAYVVADSFIGNNTTNFDGAYAGVFVLLNSYTVWNPDEYDYTESDNNDGHTLPSGYNMTIGKDKDDIKSIYTTIEESMLEAKKTLVYNLDVNTMGVEQMEKAITYYEKAYKSLWK
ncbi:MAG: InlB B-repeat-containing protein [Clostridia bacterium]|nr:InlB B-repeat-containing protein [Clostridia bacterium]